MNLTANIVTAHPDPATCSEHPGCFVTPCNNMWCNQPVHHPNQPGQPRRFCSTRCRVAHHRGTR